jgi:transposase
MQQWIGQRMLRVMRFMLAACVPARSSDLVHFLYCCWCVGRDPPVFLFPRARSRSVSIAASMPAPLSRQLCKKIVLKHATQGRPNAEIARELDVDPHTVAAVLGRWRRGELLEKPGRKGIVDQKTKFRRVGGLKHLKRILEEYECIYLDEIADELERRTGSSFSKSTVCRAIKQLGWTKKKVSGA